MESIKWGYRSGKQRYKCKNCGILFTSSNSGLSKSNEEVWFRKWVVERLTLRYLSAEMGISKRSLQRKFSSYLSSVPRFSMKQNDETYLVIDGTYFPGDLCLVLYYDTHIRYTQLYRFTDKERFEQIKEDLLNLIKLGINIRSVTCDGHHAILKAISTALPDVTTQRCLVHIHRESNIWLRKRPVNQRSIELKKIVNLIFLIKTNNDKVAWVGMFDDWFEIHKDYINEKKINTETGRWWYRHKTLRRAAIMIKKAIPNMFHFLDNPNIPKSTNNVESFFGHLKDTLSIHRGLSRKNRQAFILWYLHYKNQTRH